MTVPVFTLSNGQKIPALSFGSGTQLKNRGDVIKLVSDALKFGYTHIDCAEIYGSEALVCEAIKQSGLKREDLYITTKVFRYLDDPVGSLNESLKRLGTNYVDLFLIHTPYPAEEQGTTIEAAWKGLEQVYKEGKVKSIGVSNFRVDHLERILEIAEVKPVVNQIEFSAYLQNQTPGIYEFCQKHGILIEAYSPMAVFHPDAKSGPLLPFLDELSKKYNKTPSQIVFRWVYQAKGVLSITSTVSEARSKEALESYDFELEEADAKKITELGASFDFRRFPQNTK